MFQRQEFLVDSLVPAEIHMMMRIIGLLYLFGDLEIIERGVENFSRCIINVGRSISSAVNSKVLAAGIAVIGEKEKRVAEVDR